MSIDERRSLFKPHLFAPLVSTAHNALIKEVWFAGVHSDVVGMYREHESRLSQIALHWILNEAVECGLSIDATKAENVVTIHLNVRRGLLESDKFSVRFSFGLV